MITILWTPYTPERHAEIVAEQAALGNVYVTDLANLNDPPTYYIQFEDDPGYVAFANALATDPVIQGLQSASFSQINTWIDNNITSLAEAKVLFKKLALVVAYLLRRALREDTK